MDIREAFTLANLIFAIAVAPLVAALWRLVAHAFGRPPRSELLYWVSVIPLTFVIVAILLLPLTQDTAPVTQVTQDTAPAFRVSLDDISVATLPGREGDQIPFVSLIASISNTGGPSAVSGLRFTVRAPQGSPIEGEAIAIPSEFTISRGPDIVETVYGEDALNIKAEEQPIARGSTVRGRMFYVFPKVLLGDLSALGTTYELTVTDTWGRQYAASGENLGLAMASREFPQIRQRFTRADAPEESPN